MSYVRSFQIRRHRVRPHARSTLACHIHVIGLRFFQREPHEFATPLVGITVVELVSHVRSPILKERKAHQVDDLYADDPIANTRRPAEVSLHRFRAAPLGLTYELRCEGTEESG